MYKLVYFNQSGKPVETIFHGAPIGVCLWKKKTLENSTHKYGYFTITKN